MAEALASLRGLSREEVEAVTLENGKRLYRIQLGGIQWEAC